MIGQRLASAPKAPAVPPASLPKPFGCTRLPNLVAGAPNLEILKKRRPDMACKADQTEMAAAEKRWETQIKEGKVKNVTCKGAGDLMKDGWVVLDVRPTSEVRKATVDGAVVVPLYVPDKGMDPASLLKQMSAFGMGGWWLGGTHMEPNPDFLAQVQNAIPKDAKVVVGCQKGLRSLSACEQLARAGYQSLAWINGGFDTAIPGDLPVIDDADLRLAGIGGVSAALGMAPQQAAAPSDEPSGGQQILKVAAVVLALDLLVFGYEQFKFLSNQ